MCNALIDLSAQVGDKLIEGDELSEDQIKLVKTVYALAKIWGADTVTKTETNLDDKGLSNLFSLLKDTAEEGNFSLLIE